MSTRQLHDTASPASDPQLPPPHAVLFDLAFGATAPRVLQVIAEHGVADELIDGERVDAATLADRAGCDADALQRMMRLLASFGIFALVDGGWEHTECSVLLRSDHPHSMRAFARMLGQPLGWHCLTKMGHSLNTGRTTTELLDPDGLFSYLEDHPGEGAVFNDAMTSKAHGDIAAILAADVFEDCGIVVDIGGGHGHLLRAILDADPDARGVLFDLPHVIGQAHTRADGRLHLHAGDFFTDAVPTHHTAVLMHIIHDWDDDAASVILHAVRAAAAPTSKLVLLEHVISDRQGPDPAKVLDVAMLTSTGGRERTADQFTTLLAGARFCVDHITPLATGLHVIAASPLQPEAEL